MDQRLREIGEAPRVAAWTEETFTESLGDGLTVIDFWASWDGPSRLLSQEFARAARQRPEHHFGKVNVDTEPALADRFEVRESPTVIVFRDGRPALRLTGLTSAATLIGRLDALAAQPRAKPLVPAARDRTPTRARALLKA